MLWTQRQFVANVVSLALLLGAAALLSGCAPDPLAGNWRTKKLDCGRRGTMTLDETWVGEAELPVNCERTCELEVDAYEKGDPEYFMKVEVDTPSVCQVEGGGTKAKYDCTLEDEGTTLDCGNFHVWSWQGE